MLLFLFGFIIFIIILYLIFGGWQGYCVNSIFEGLENQNNIIEYQIQQLVVPEYDIDQYIIYNNDGEEKYRTFGNWTLENERWGIIDRKQNIKNKIEIKRNDNIYQFDSINGKSMIKYLGFNKGIQGELGNNTIELRVIEIDKNGEKKWEYYDGQKKLAEIELIDKINKKTHNFILKLNDKNMEKYLSDFIIVFIVLRHMEKEMEYNFDNLDV